MKRVLSRYVSQYDMGDGTVGLFSSVFLTKRFMDRDHWSRVRAASAYDDILAPDEIGSLEDAKIIVVEGEDDRRLDELRAGLATGPAIELMYLFVTNTCNLRCRYCIVDKERAQAETGSFMSEETADRALELFMASSRTEKTALLLWGGEPLNNWPVFKHVVERAREMEKTHSKALDIATVTNGTLLTKEIAEFLRQHRVACSVSIDGMKDQHDRMRTYADGRGTYEDIRNNVKLLKEAGVRVSISLTIGSHNVDVLPAMVPDLCKSLETTRVGCSLLLNVDAAHPAYADSERAARQLIELFKRLCEDGISEDTMTRKAKAFGLCQPHLHSCTAGGGQIAVMPNGDVGICHYAAAAGRWIIGNVRDTPEALFESPALAEWARRSPINMPQCYECPGLVMCGGGCPYEAGQRKGDIWALDERFCAHCRASIEWMMGELHQGRRGPGTARSPVFDRMQDIVDHARIIRRFMPARWAAVSALTDEELQHGADAFRLGHGLNTARATESWMSRHGVTREFLQEYLESAILFSRIRDRLYGNAVS